jgi:membrane dipeptidase
MMDAKAFHDGLVVIDGHCDTALDILGRSWVNPGAPPRDFRKRGERGHIDLPRLLEGGVTCQIMALFTDDQVVSEAREHTYRMLDAVDAALADGGACFKALTAADILRAKAEGKAALMLSIEGGEAIGESLDELCAFYGRGVRLMGLTWNRRNAIARGVGAEGNDGLTSFGRRVVAEMEKLGMVVDASHLSDAALDELLEIAQRPVVASHSNSRAICPHRRNLEDSQIERIAATGGLVAVTFAGVFVDPDPAAVTLARLADHVQRLVSAAGADHVGVGSDFDGFTEKYGMALKDCSSMPLLTAALLDRGLEPDDVAKIMGGNWLRIIREVVG